jgi:hypothetical protein
MRAELPYADGKKLIATFHNFVNAPKMVGYESSKSPNHSSRRQWGHCNHLGLLSTLGFHRAHYTGRNYQHLEAS